MPLPLSLSKRKFGSVRFQRSVRSALKSRLGFLVSININKFDRPESFINITKRLGKGFKTIDRTTRFKFMRKNIKIPDHLHDVPVGANFSKEYVYVVSIHTDETRASPGGKPHYVTVVWDTALSIRETIEKAALLKFTTDPLKQIEDVLKSELVSAYKRITFEELS